MMYSLDEVGLIPAQTTDIESRKIVNPYVQSPFGGDKLPIFVAPMTCILGANNICTFSRSLVEPILPVVEGDLSLRRQLPNGADWLGWTAVSLYEFENMLNNNEFKKDKKQYILIDMATGHMKKLFDMIHKAKQEYGDSLIIMMGNIGNPNTYLECCKARVDFVRIGIGGGSGCTTSVKTGIHTSILHILEGIKNVKNLIHNYEVSAEVGMRIYDNPEIAEINGFRTKIVADGGINTISRAIKALALGADYVMMGKCFAQCEEGNTGTAYYATKGNKADPELQKHHLYYGQASVEGQLDRFGKVKSNPEGVALWVPVTSTLEEFTTEFENDLRCAMSYANAFTLDEFIGKVDYNIMSPSEFASFNK